MAQESLVNVEPADQLPEWKALQAQRERMRACRLSELFEQDSGRAERFSLRAQGLLMDYSKHFLDAEVLDLLLALARRSGLEQATRRMFEGAAINNTEQRPALHVALRSPKAESAQEKAVQQTLRQMEHFVNAVLQGEWKGFGDRAITDVVNIGIGGSDLGPAMAYQALAPYHIPGLDCHFVSNVDPSHLHQVLHGLDPETTLFVVASKSFTTLETSQNAEAARQWLLDAAGRESALAQHFVAVSANVDKAGDFGIDRANIFPMWDWVGGRYSLWSAIGLPIALGVGMPNFRALLEGAHGMDEHFRTAPPERNMPVLMGLLALWYLNFFGAETQAVLPYDQNLCLFPAFLQQLDMESLGKSVRRDGASISLETGGIVWGSAGTNGQHSFHQLIHQGTHLIPADFIAAMNSHYDAAEQHRHLIANCLAQSQAMLQGKSLDQARRELRDQGLDAAAVESLAPHKVIPGNRPSTTILMERLTPQTLGALVAAYEHKVYVQSVILQINAFDQWGVELGKVLSSGLFKSLSGEADTKGFDASTRTLIRYYRDNS